MADIENRDLREFLNKSETTKSGTQSRGKSSVIKNIRTRQSENDPIKIPVHRVGGSDQPQIEPILEKGLIVGIQFTCTCHKTTEIRFEYDDPAPKRQPGSGNR